MKSPAPNSLAQRQRDLLERYEGLLTMTGYDDCLAGVCRQFGGEVVAVYDRAKVITRLIADGMSREEAEEFHEFNQAGAWVGPNSPLFLERV